MVLIALKKKCGLTCAWSDLISASRIKALCVSAWPNSSWLENISASPVANCLSE